VAVVQYTFTQKQYTVQHNQSGNSAGSVPSLRVIPCICLTNEEKERENLIQGSRRVSVGTMETEYTQQNV